MDLRKESALAFELFEKVSRRFSVEIAGFFLPVTFFPDERTISEIPNKSAAP